MLADGARLVHLRAKAALGGSLHADGTDFLSNGDAAASSGAWPVTFQTEGLLHRLGRLDLHLSSWGPDSFVLYYWLCVAFVVAFVIFVVNPVLFPEEDDSEEEDEETANARYARLEQEAFESLDQDHSGRLSKDEVFQAEERLEHAGLSLAQAGIGAVLSGPGTPRGDNPDGANTPPLTARSTTQDLLMPKEVHLPENMWALNLIAAIGQAKTGNKLVSPYFTAVITMTMASLQIAVLFLVVHDINPNATPVTIESSDPWIHTGWTVNCMKWLMVTFMCLLMVTEAGEFRDNVTCILEINSHRINVSRLFLAFICSFQYIIMLFVIWGGVAAVLSFQSVPDILYSSMSITYISKVDEAFYVMLMQLLDVEADFCVVHGRKVAKMSSESIWASLDADGDGQVTQEEFSAFQERQRNLVNDEKLRPRHIGHWGQHGLHFLAAFPCLLGFAMIGRAMHTNVMPTQRLHAMKDTLMAVLNSF